MAKKIKVIKELLSFTRGELIGIAVLFLILLAFIIYPHIISTPKIEDDIAFAEFKEKVDEFEKNKETLISNKNIAKPEIQKTQKQEQKTKARKYEEFYFDPNSISSGDLERLGFSQKQATVIINYRNKGGVFKEAQDFKKIYVVSDEYYARLEPYIKIEKNDSPALSAPKVAEKAKPAAAIVELNSADTSELKKLKGIGPYYAKQIIIYRTKLGGFADINQLKEIYGIDEERFAGFYQQLQLNKEAISKIKINEADEKTLIQHPYIDNNLAKGILQYRKLSGKIESLDVLISGRILTSEKAEQLQLYIEF